MSSTTSNDSIPANVLDLTDKQTLFELAIEDRELLGPNGARLIGDLKERAVEAEYTHMYFRDPIRPGIVWFAGLVEGSQLALPTRGRLDICRKTTEKVFPKFLGSLDDLDEQVVMQAIPPITNDGPSGLDLATALEYLVFVYPGMVRAWAALIFTYDQIMNLKDGAESARAACIGTCPNSQVVSYLLDEPVTEA